MRQLAHVARPRLGEEPPQRQRREAEGRPADALADPREEAIDERQDVLPTLTKRRDRQPDDVEAVVEVGLKATLADVGLERPVGGGDQTNVGRESEDDPPASDRRLEGVAGEVQGDLL